jgi:crotonobetainyl-CoA:carnitine CoA-transferase CaiB-like acyl-CoA transferase
MALVLDLTSEVGAYGTRLLAELGHDLVRIENPAGDALRRLHPHLNSEPDLESSAFHQFLNAGKRSLAVDLDSEDGRRIFLALVAKAEAVVASLPLPFDEAALRVANQDVALVRIDDGPPELVAFARSGLLAMTGEPDGAPTLLGGHVPHAAVGVYVAIAAAAALLNGAGQVVDVWATQCLASLAEQAWVEYGASGELLERLGSTGGITALAGALPCADGHWMVSVPPDPQGWTNFVQLMPDPALKDDASLADEALRRERKHEILDRISLWFRRQRKQEIVEAAQRHHIPAAPVTNPLELVADPQLLARGFLKPLDHPIFGRINYPMGALARISGKEVSFAPRLGQDTVAILSELGYSAAEIGRLEDQGVVKTMPAPPGAQTTSGDRI